MNEITDWMADPSAGFTYRESNALVMRHENAVRAVEEWVRDGGGVDGESLMLERSESRAALMAALERLVLA